MLKGKGRKQSQGALWAMQEAGLRVMLLACWGTVACDATAQMMPKFPKPVISNMAPRHYPLADVTSTDEYNRNRELIARLRLSILKSADRIEKLYNELKSLRARLAEQGINVPEQPVEHSSGGASLPAGAVINALTLQILSMQTLRMELQRNLELERKMIARKNTLKGVILQRERSRIMK